MSLACGGRGPCCHIGYAHRHCEHCDYVIPLQHYHWGGYYQQPYWGYQTYGGVGGIATGLSSQLSNQFTQLQALAEGHSHAGK